MRKAVVVPLLLSLAACQVDVDGTAQGEPEPEKRKGVYAMAEGGGTVMYETSVDDGGSPALQVDYTISLFEELHSIAFPITIITEDADGNEIRRRILDDLDAAAEDDTFLAAGGRADLVRKLTADPADSTALWVIDFYRNIIDHPDTPAEELPYFIATIRGLWTD